MFVSFVLVPFAFVGFMATIFAIVEKTKRPKVFGRNNKSHRRRKAT